MIILKTENQIDTMDKANLIVHRCLDRVEKEICIGITTKKLESYIEDELLKIPDAIPVFKGYGGFPGIACISVNEEIVHGIPGNRVINDGDIVSVDFGVLYNGFVGDAARSFLIGNVSDEVKSLSDATKKALFAGIDQMVPENRLYDINEAIDKVAKENKYGNLLNFCGHGVGQKLHEPPAVFNYIERREPNIRLRPGMVFALEPMFTLGSNSGVLQEDKWTVVTKCGSPSAHWELSVAITKNGPKILGVQQ